MEEAPPARRFGHVELALRLTIVFLVLIPVSVLYWIACIILLPSRMARIRTGNLYGKLIGPTTFRMAGAKLVISNRERVDASRPALFVSNHTSTVDMWIGMWLCPYGGCGVAKKEIVRIPFFGQAYLLSGHLLVDRGNREKAIASMKKVEQVVRKHKLSLWMWPEGTRSRDGRLRKLKKGVVHLAIATRLPIVPIVMHDAHKRWPAGTLRASPGELRIDVLEPIETTDWNEDTIEEHAETIWAAFQGALAPHQQTPEE